MKKFEIKVEMNVHGEIAMEATNEGFSAHEIIGLLEMKKMDIAEQLINPQNFIHRRRFKDKDGEWTEVVKDGESDGQKKTEVETAETADVQEVRHGRWISNDLCWYKLAYYCSECGWVDEYAFNERHKYCPNCGAKMDGDEK